MKILVIISLIGFSLFTQCESSKKTDKKPTTIDLSSKPEPAAPIQIGTTELYSTLISVSNELLTVHVKSSKQGQGGPIVGVDENLAIDITSISKELREQLSKLSVNTNHTFSIQSKKMMNNENGIIQLVSIK